MEHPAEKRTRIVDVPLVRALLPRRPMASDVPARARTVDDAAAPGDAPARSALLEVPRPLGVEVVGRTVVLAFPTPAHAHTCAAAIARDRHAPGAAVCRREGEYWTFAFDGRLVRVADLKGIRYLAVLLAQPHRPVVATELAGMTRRHRAVRSAASAHARGDHGERARLAVTQRIRAAVARIAAGHEALGRHLRTAVRTGARCVYDPEPSIAVPWDVDGV